MPIKSLGDSTMLHTEKFELLIGRRGMAAQMHHAQDQMADGLPGVPVLTETLLRMELELHEGSTDLRGFSEAVLADLGATIQILRLAGQEYGEAFDRPIRVEDCISDLGPRACMNAAATGSLLRGVRQHASFEMWAHSREVAQYFRLLAEQAPASISADQAYMAGLLHAIGALPAVLEWGRYGISGEPALAALKMAERWHFPRFIREFFCELLMPGDSPEWSNFIAVAHQPAKESWARCPLNSAPLRSFA